MDTQEQHHRGFSHGPSVTGTGRAGEGTGVPPGGTATSCPGRVRHHDVGCFVPGEVRVENLDHHDGDDSPDHFSDHEGWDRRRGDAGECVENMRPTAMAGLAKLVELVKKYAAPM